MRVRESRASLRAIGIRVRPRRRRTIPHLEGLETRALLATISVNARQVVRPVNTQLLGVNVAWYDSVLNTQATQQMVQAAGLTMFRFPGGSSSDDFHFNAPPTYNGEGTDGSMASFISSVNGVGMATIDYGSGSPQEAAAFLAYLNYAPGWQRRPRSVSGRSGTSSTNPISKVDWKTAGYWASLRSRPRWPPMTASISSRLDHPSPFGIHYWGGSATRNTRKLGNPTTTLLQHDPATYITFAKAIPDLRCHDRPEHLDRPRRGQPR